MRQITVLLISSTLDPASKNIKDEILNLSDWIEVNTFFEKPVYQKKDMKDIILITLPDRKITHENIEYEVKEKLNIKPKQAIFLSKHTSKTGEPTLSVHPLGNYGEAKFGGKEKTLSTAAPKTMTQLLRILKKNASLEKLYHSICFEVTHHGPYMSIPTVFIEVGSTEEEWNNKKACRVLAKTLLDLFKKYHYEEDFSDKTQVVVGIGGGHYAPRFTDVALEKDIAFGHMIPNYHIKEGNITDDMIKQALEKTPNSSGIYIHRKSMKKSQVTEYKRWCEENNISVISSKNLENI